MIHSLFFVLLPWYAGIKTVLLSFDILSSGNIALLRDLFFFGMLAIHIMKYPFRFDTKYKKMIQWAGLFLLFSLPSYFFVSVWFPVFIAFRYDFFLWIGVAVFLLFPLPKHIQNLLVKISLWSLFTSLCISFLGHIFFSSSFYHFLGYSQNLSEFIPFSALSIQTAGSFLRFSGFFSGPNQLGYILVFAFPFWYDLTSTFCKLWKYFLRALWGIFLFATFSKSALIGITLFFFLLLYKQKKSYETFVFLFFVSAFVIFSPLFLRKASLEKHWDIKKAGVSHMMKSPLGTGAGTSGPATHFHQPFSHVFVSFEEYQNAQILCSLPDDNHYFMEYDEKMRFKPTNTDELARVFEFSPVSQECKTSLEALFQGRFIPRIPENWFVQIFQEYGFLSGISYFIFLFHFLAVLKTRKYSYFASAVSGIFLGMFLHVFEDMSVNYLLVLFFTVLL
jgi:hypothetical protein